jgi:hypothetical protein
MRGSTDSVVSLYYLRHLQNMMEELFSGHHLKFEMPETAKYKKRRQRKLYNCKRMRKVNAGRSRRLRKLAC